MSTNANEDRPESGNPGAPPEPSAPQRRRLFALPDGSMGIFLLLILAAGLGGLIAAYWPTLFGIDNGLSEERIASLEARVGQLAAGHGGAAASGVFNDLRRNLGALTDRLDADEARLMALEKAPGVATAPGQAPASADTSALRSAIDASAAAVAQLKARIDALEKLSPSAQQLTQASEAFGKLQARVAALDADIARFAETQKGTMDAVNMRLAKLEAALPPNLAQTLETLASKADMGGVDARVAHLEAENSGESLHRAAAILALANLSGAAAEGRPFTIELDALAAAQPRDPAIAALRPWAATGVPTVAALRARFPAAARGALEVAHVTGATDYFERLWANLASLVSVRRVGEVEGTGIDARLARAQARMDTGDLPGAVAEAGAVTPPAAAALAPWLKDARARVALDRMVAQMNARVVRALAMAASAAPADTHVAEPSAPAPAQVPTPVPAPGHHP